MSPPETPLSAACLSWRRRRRAGWAAASQGRSPSAHPGTCGHEGGEVAGRGTAAPRGPSGAGGSPACVHRGEREGHALEQQDHEESLAGRAVSHALAVLAGLGAGSWGIRAASRPRPGHPAPRDRSSARAPARHVAGAGPRLGAWEGRRAAGSWGAGRGHRGGTPALGPGPLPRISDPGLEGGVGRESCFLSDSQGGWARRLAPH